MRKGLIVDKYGTKEYYLNGLYHRADGPAVEYKNGTKCWYIHGERHKADGPAEIWANGSKVWWVDGKKHRVDGPAVEFSDGGKAWYLHGELHRIDGPVIEYANGSKVWYLHGKQLIRPDEFKTMEDFFTKLNDNEEYSLPWINDFNGIIEYIKKPTPKQKRLHALKWKL